MSKKIRIAFGTLIVVAAIAAVIIVWRSSNNEVRNDVSRFGVPSAQAAEPIGHIGTGKAAEAMEKAGQDDKYVFALFLKEENEQTAKARSLVQSVRSRVSRKSESLEINTADATEQDVVKKFGVNRAPMPLVLVVAPNGAIMGGFTAAQLDEQRLMDAVGSKGSEQALKALQQRNMVLLCVQNRKTSQNSDAMRGVEEFVKDPQYAASTAVVKVDPSDPAEAKFLSQMKVDSKTNTASTVLLAPPGSVVGSFNGALKKDQLVSAVQSMKSGGCGPGGCGGKPCGPAPTKGK